MRTPAPGKRMAKTPVLVVRPSRLSSVSSAVTLGESATRRAAAVAAAGSGIGPKGVWIVNASRPTRQASLAQP